MVGGAKELYDQELSLSAQLPPPQPTTHDHNHQKKTKLPGILFWHPFSLFWLHCTWPWLYEGCFMGREPEFTRNSVERCGLVRGSCGIERQMRFQKGNPGGRHQGPLHLQSCPNNAVYDHDTQVTHNSTPIHVQFPSHPHQDHRFLHQLRPSCSSLQLDCTYTGLFHQTQGSLALLTLLWDSITSNVCDQQHMRHRLLGVFTQFVSLNSLQGPCKYIAESVCIPAEAHNRTHSSLQYIPLDTTQILRARDPSETSNCQVCCCVRAWDGRSVW